MRNKEETKVFLDEIIEKLNKDTGDYIHSILVLNEMFLQPNAQEIFQGEVKDVAKEIWLRAKNSGLQLSDPPILFPLGEVKN